VGGCATKSPETYVKDGKVYGVTKGAFRSRWWNYYERGASFAEGKFWEEAIADFQEAIKQRDEDQRRTRTYGFHFVDYFPHRELGIAYYYTDRREEAISELAYSLSTVATAKAKYFLNLARKALLEEEASDAAPPALTIASPKDKSITNRLSTELEGVAEDDHFVSSIYINGNPLFLELSEKSIPFTQRIPLKLGANHIDVEARDLTGKNATASVEIVVDRAGPAIAIESPLPFATVQTARARIEGVVLDDQGIDQLTIDGQVLSFEGKKEGTFSKELPLKEGENTLTLRATDIVGNVTKGEINLFYSPAGKAPSESKRSPLRPLTHLAFAQTSLLDSGLALFISSEDSDSPSPTISINHLTESQTVYLETIFLEGNVVGECAIESVTVNGNPFIARPTRNLFFNHLLDLEEGENTVTVEAKDCKGRTASKEITMIRQIPKVRRLGTRMALAILPFEEKGERVALGSFIYDGLTDTFFQQERFNLVAREKELEEILRELKLSKTDLVDQSKALELGRIAAAEVILAGSVYETEDSVEIYARLINSETSTIMAAHDVFDQDKSLPKLKYLMEGLALKFRQSVPLLEGFVVNVEEATIYADLGAKHRLKREMKLIIFREGDEIVHPVTKKTLGYDTEELGEARVEEVMEELSIGKLLGEGAFERIVPKDKVITK
jgi:TolB-like protein